MTSSDQGLVFDLPGDYLGDLLLLRDWREEIRDSFLCDESARVSENMSIFLRFVPDGLALFSGGGETSRSSFVLIRFSPFCDIAVRPFTKRGIVLRRRADASKVSWRKHANTTSGGCMEVQPVHAGMSLHEVVASGDAPLQGDDGDEHDFTWTLSKFCLVNHPPHWNQDPEYRFSRRRWNDRGGGH